jgi:hypothetical protein
MDDDIRALLSPEGVQQYLRQREIDDFNLAELRRRRLELYPEPEEKPQPRTTAMDKQTATATYYVTWHQLDKIMSFLGAEVGKAENRANAKIKALEADVAALKCELAIVQAHKMSKPVAAEGSVTSLRGRHVA